MKQCSVCKVKKQTKEFNKKSCNRSGVRSDCRKCQNEENRVWIAKKRLKKKVCEFLKVLEEFTISEAGLYL